MDLVWMENQYTFYDKANANFYNHVKHEKQKIKI